MSLLVVLTAGAIVLVTLIAGVRAIDELSRARIERTAARVESDLDDFFGSVQAHVEVTRKWAASGLLDIHDHENLNKIFVPLLDRNPYLSSMMVANTRGEEFMLLRDPVDRHLWTNRITRVLDSAREVRFLRWNDETGEEQETVSDLQYDPRGRLWFKDGIGVTGDQPISWTRPAIFFVTKDPGVTVSTSWSPDAASSETTVVAFDLLLMDLSDFTRSLEVSESGRAFVLFEEPDSQTLRVVGLPGDSAFGSAEAVRRALTSLPADQAVADAPPTLPSAEGFGVGPVDASVWNWKQLGRPEGAITYEEDGDDWWAGFFSYDLGANKLWIVVAVPEKDFAGGMIARIQRIGIVALIALIIAIAMSILMAKGYSRPLEQLVTASRRLGKLELEQTDDVSTKLLEFEELAHEQERMRVTLDSFSRYVPVDLVRELLEQGEAARIGGSREVITVLFSDIVGYTTLSEGVDPQELTQHMAGYFESLLDTIRSNSGEVNQLLGDGVLASWGAPKADPAHAAHAVAGVLEAAAALSELNRNWEKQGLPVLPTRFGLATGEVMVGNVGSPSRLSYALMGDTVNLASRIESLTRYYGTVILVAESVKDSAGPDFEWLLVDTVRVKGRNEALGLFAPLGRVGSVPDRDLQMRDLYEEARELYRDRDFAGALDKLRALYPEWAEQPFAARFIELVEHLTGNQPDADWEAVTNFTQK